MATFYDYRYDIDGDKIALLQRTQEIIYDPHVDYGDEIYVTPTVADSSAILLKYTVTIAAPGDEQTDIGVSRYLGLAIVHYVKAKAVEDSDIRLYEWNMNKFRYYVQRERNSKLGSPRMGLSNYTGSVK
jgi:hypothetical protein